MAKLTPLMKQYMEIKEKYKDSILFFRLGDFYEMFDEDARLVARELDIALTTRDRTKPESEQTMMCGVPHHTCESYVARLIAKGYKVAICDQMEKPGQKKDVVRRDVTRVITPGTVIDSGCLEDRRSSFLAAVFLDELFAGVAFCDMSTGYTYATAMMGVDRVYHLMNELSRFEPVEAVVNAGVVGNAHLYDFLENRIECSIEHRDHRFTQEEAQQHISRQFGAAGESVLRDENPAARLALGALFGYLRETQRADLSYISHLEHYEQGEYMELDLAARRNLELTETLRNKERRGSLIWVLDHSKTAMGGRKLRSYIDRPLCDVAAIQRRQGAVSVLQQQTMAREEIMHALESVADMERLIGRIVYGTAGGRDLISLRNSIRGVQEIREQLAPIQQGMLTALYDDIDPMDDIARLIDDTLTEKPPLSVRDGGVIRDGYNAEVDRLRDILNGSKRLLDEVETRERERTGIRTLKVHYNKVFGYYIEISNSFLNKIPEDYIRRQTLTTGERFITEELKELEHEILTAGERVCSIEFEIFSALRDSISSESIRIQQTASAIAELDALCSLAHVAVHNQYVCPTVDNSGEIEIHDGRHPVVEKVIKDELFVPNDTLLGQWDNRVLILTGPNMAGKSTYMRQVALITLMAQIGSFVPARAARIGIVDRIFTRIGASDDLAAGKSTFMVEMSEVAELLRLATPNSLLLLDEIGRGTSTFDGMSIARAVLEHCADTQRLGAKTLFATHYHELTELEDKLPGTKNFSIAVRTRGDEILFLRKIIPGGADRSYGVEVAKLAGLPEEVISRAKEILSEFETATPPMYCEQKQGEIHLAVPEEMEILEALRRLQPETLSLLEAMQLLMEWKKKLQ